MKQLIGIAVGLVFLAACTAQPDEAQQVIATATPIPTAPAAERTTYVVERGDVREEFVFTGRWLPRDQLELSFEVSGSVRSVNVRRGDTISQGQVLADLQIDELEARLETELLNLQTAQRRLEESGTSGEDGVVNAQFNLANQSLALESQQAGLPWTNVENARTNVETAERNRESAERTYNDLISRPDTPASQVDQAYQSLLAAQEQLETAERNLASAQSQYYQATIQLQQQENNVLQAELSLEDAQQSGGDPDLVDAVISTQLAVDRTREQIMQSTLFAPFDGVVLEVTIQPGDTVQAYTGVITIALPAPLEVNASLSFAETQLLQVGQVGTCQESNHPETLEQCIVRQLPLSNQDVDQSVRIAATLPDTQQGALVEVTMILNESSNVLWLPPEAINEFGTRTFVVLQTPDGERVRDVTLGLRTDDRIEILSGVQEGDIVVQQ